jgi:Domain of unknown function (DUF2017)
VRAFQRGRAGTVGAQFSPEEAAILQNLASQVAGMVLDAGDALTNPDALELDPALARLFPDAYPKDSDASAEFRRFTVGGLARNKADNAATVIRTLATADVSGQLSLDAEAISAWLRSLTDMRLTLAARLGIERDDQPPAEDSVMQDVYDWLGFIQNSLVEAVAR